MLCFYPSTLYVEFVSTEYIGNGIIDEAEFLQWVARIQALRDDSPNKSATNSPDDEDDITQDLIAAFR